MAKLPQVSGKNLVKALQKDDCVKTGQRGSHVKLVKYRSPTGKGTVIVPQHKVLKKGTLARILKDAKLSPQKLQELL